MELKRHVMKIKSFNPETGEFSGDANVYGVVDSYNEIVEKGAFTRTLEHKGGKFPLLWQHNPDVPIGINELEDSDYSLRVRKGTINLETQAGREAHSLAKQGAVTGLSIGFETVKDAWDGAIRKLKEVKLWEVSLVTFPANPASHVTAVKNFMNQGMSLDLALLAVVGAGETKAGRVLSKGNRELVLKAHEALGALLEASNPDEDPDKKSTPPGSPPPAPAIDQKEAEEVQKMLEEIRNGFMQKK